MENCLKTYDNAHMHTHNKTHSTDFVYVYGGLGAALPVQKQMLGISSLTPCGCEI